MEWLLILTVGLVAGTLGGIVGFGSSVMLVPVLALTLGPKDAVPIMAVASLMANVSRVAMWWREVDWRAVGVYSVTAVPAAALGARTLVAMNARAVEAVLGVFLLAMVPLRHWLRARGWRVRLPHLAAVGAAIGFLTGIVATTGPVNAPFFLAYGLVKGAYLSTEALGSAAVYLTKAAVFRQAGVLPVELLGRGLVVGSSLTAGAWIAKRIVQRMAPGDFRLLMDGLLLAAGATMLAQAVSG